MPLCKANFWKMALLKGVVLPPGCGRWSSCFPYTVVYRMPKFSICPSIFPNQPTSLSASAKKMENLKVKNLCRMTRMQQSFFAADYLLNRTTSDLDCSIEGHDRLTKANQALADWQTVDSAFLRSVFYQVTNIPPIFMGLIEYFVKYERSNGWELPVDEKKCSVCMEPMSGGLFSIGERPIKLCCGHIIGERCLAAWLWQFKGNSNKCPTCRTEYWYPTGERLKDLDLRSPKLLKMDPDSRPDANPKRPYDCVMQVWNRAINFLQVIQMRMLQFRAYSDRQPESRRRCLLENSLKIMVVCCQYSTNNSPVSIALDHTAHADKFYIESHMFIINWVPGAIPAVRPVNKTILHDISRISERLARLSNTPRLWEMSADDTNLYEAESSAGPFLGHLRTIRQQVQDIETVWAAHQNPATVTPATHLAAHNRLDEGRVARGYISQRLSYNIPIPDSRDGEDQLTQQERQQDRQQEEENIEVSDVALDMPIWPGFGSAELRQRGFPFSGLS